MSNDDQIFEVPLEWHFPDSIISRYATNLVVQNTEHEFILSFFEFNPPIVLGTPEERREQIEKLETVRGECVARIIVSPERLPNFINVLQDNLKRYQTKKDQMDD